MAAADPRTPEQVAADQAAHDAEHQARHEAQQARTGYFDRHGVCRMIVDGGHHAPEGFAYAAPVPKEATPNEVWYDAAEGAVKNSASPPVALPDVVEAAEGLTVELPEGTVAEVNGKLCRRLITIDPGDPATHVVELHGRHRGTFHVDARTYREHRAAAYLPIAEQLDLMSKDPTRWLEHIADVKSRFPKGPRT